MRFPLLASNNILTEYYYWHLLRFFFGEQNCFLFYGCRTELPKYLQLKFLLLNLLRSGNEKRVIKNCPNFFNSSISSECGADSNNFICSRQLLYYRNKFSIGSNSCRVIEKEFMKFIDQDRNRRNYSIKLEELIICTVEYLSCCWVIDIFRDL